MLDSANQKTREELARDLAEHAYLTDVVSVASTTSIASVYATSTIVKPPDVTIRGRWGASQIGFLGEELLLNYQPYSSSMAYGMGIGRFFQPDAIIAASHADLDEDTKNAINLPRPRSLRGGISAVISSRRSKRNFSDGPISMSDLSTLLQHAYGVSGRLSPGSAPIDAVGDINLRCAQSGGGLYPITLYVVPINVSEMELGFYEYQPNAHSLRPTGVEIGRDELSRLCYTQDFDILRAGVGIVYVYTLHKNSYKYGDCGVVLALIEVGGIAQNLHLIRTALGLAGCCQGGYDKQGLERALGIDGVSRHVVHMSVIGQEEN